MMPFLARVASVEFVLAQAGPSSAQPLAPAWLVLPMAIITLVVVGLHANAMHAPNAGVPRSRRVIRSINAGLMLVTVPTLAYAFGIVTPSRPQAFAVAWAAVILLLALIIVVALLDVLNTWRLHAGQREGLSDQIRALRRAAEREVHKRRDGGPSSDPPSDDPKS